MMHRHPANVARHDERTVGDRVADDITKSMGSWRFIIAQAVFTAAWIVVNTVHGWGLMWDSYPYVLLNLVYSFQAGFTGPILLLSQNRQAEHDRLRAEHDYGVNEEALAWSRAIGARLDVQIPQAVSPDVP
ncbi:DUF1003 domain-containing protein [Kitasatospora kifunensis]|uniref:Putative membrane protein n=1 Tax=Kitasatospora kifunensis TaxID=58351 RepID=A0A7W7VU47_KITKI|nr:DUF1003 domain-containing protein [Kitasatospora kifunensis]MBB4922289.1 putative membrane protein [Kitasatospora kifunensis]